MGKMQAELEPDDEEQEERPRRRPPRPPRELDDACQTLQASQMMWTKFGIAAIFGLASAVVYLAVRKGTRPIASVDPESELGAIPAVPWPQPAALPPAPPMVAPVAPAAPQAARRPPAPARVTGNVITQSYRLPRLGDSKRTAPRVAQATDVPYDVVMRTVGPAGTWATFAYSSTELDMANGGSYPVGQTLTIPAGQWQPIRLQPHEVLYAKGNTDGVTISLTLTEVLG